MIRQTSDDPTADDADIQGWMTEAGDPGIEPRLDHIEQVRELLLSGMGASAPRRSWPRPFLWLAAACVLAAATLGILSLPGRSDNAWARVVQALQERPWIHSVTQGPHWSADESWVSPRHEIFAYRYDHGPTERTTEYHDLKTGIYFKYVAEENVIYRLPEEAIFKKHSSRQFDFWTKLIRGEATALDDFLPQSAEMVGPKIHEITEDGKTWTAYEWKASKPARKDDAVARLRLLVDPKTRLPRFCDGESANGDRLRREFDYPDTGPADIVAMGVPPTAKRVDRVPANDLNRVLDGLKAGRNRFDDYCGYAWDDDGMNAWRVWRKRHKWRVERLQSKINRSTRPIVADNSDPAWFRLHEKDFLFELQAVCDGRTVWYYRYPPQDLDSNQPYIPQKPSSVMSHEVYGSDDDPSMPWPHMLPEQIGHRHIGLPSAERRFTLDTEPKDGPPGTIRIQVRDTDAKDPKEPDRYRLWIDPEKNYLAIRAENNVYDRPYDASGKATAPWRITHISVQTLVEFARSPSGFWYPTRVLRQTPINDYNKVKYGDTVTRFVLDFEAKIPDELFQPLKSVDEGTK
jgi:hypothetical protein